MTNKKDLIDGLQSLVVLRFLCSIALSISFLFGPLSTLAWFYFLLTEQEIARATSPSAINVFAFVAFAMLIWLRKFLDRKLDVTKSRLEE